MWLTLTATLCSPLQAEDGSKVSYTTKVSFLEIYNEKIIDLLDSSSANLRKCANASRVTPPPTRFAPSPQPCVRTAKKECTLMA